MKTEIKQQENASPKKKPPLARVLLYIIAILVPLVAYFSVSGGFSARESVMTGSSSTAFPGPSAYGTAEMKALDHSVAAPGTPEASSEEGGRGTAETLDAAGAGSAEQRLVIRNRDIQLEVANVAKKADEVEKLTTTQGGFVQNLSFSTEDVEPPVIIYNEDGSSEVKQAGKSIKRALLTVKIPNKNYDSFVSAVKKLGKLETDSSTADEVTEQYVDLKARLDNARKTETRYQAILEEASKVTDMLAVEEQLSRIRETIEQMEAEKKYLERSTAMATISVNLHEPKPIITPEGRDWGFADALRRSVQGFVAMLNYMIVMLGTILPFIILYALIWLVYVKFFKKS